MDASVHLRGLSKHTYLVLVADSKIEVRVSVIRFELDSLLKVPTFSTQGSERVSIGVKHKNS